MYTSRNGNHHPTQPESVLPLRRTQPSLPEPQADDFEVTLEPQRTAQPAHFHDRHEASAHLAARLCAYAGRGDTLVLGVSRDGFPVAYDVAQALAAPLDILLVRTLDFHGRDDLAIGAVTSSGIHVRNKRVLHSLHLTRSQLGALLYAAEQDLAQRERQYRGSRPALPVRDHTVLLIDDGVTTGLTMQAAIKAVRQQGPRRIVVGVPAAALDAYRMLNAEADDMISVITPDPFWNAGTWYSDFSSVSDHEVQQLLSRAERKHPAAVLAH